MSYAPNTTAAADRQLPVEYRLKSEITSILHAVPTLYQKGPAARAQPGTDPEFRACWFGRKAAFNTYRLSQMQYGTPHMISRTTLHIERGKLLSFKYILFVH